MLLINLDAQGEIHYNTEIPHPSKDWDLNVNSIENEYELPPQADTIKHEIRLSHSSSDTEPKTGNSDYKPVNFFSTIKPREGVASSGIVARSVNIVENDRLRPDFHISNVLAAASTGGAIKKQPQVAAKIEPIYAEVSKKNKCNSPSTFQVFIYDSD